MIVAQLTADYVAEFKNPQGYGPHLILYTLYYLLCSFGLAFNNTSAVFTLDAII